MFREGKKCVIYVRVSTEMQVDGFSLDAQKNTLLRYADREGMIVKNVYEDAGKSGKSIEGRPAFKQLLRDIDDGLAIDYILVYKLSRFGRNAADILNSLEFIQSYDINLIATEEGIDSSQTSGKLLISVLSAVSEIERENILEQTMNGRKEKARQGGWNGGFAPYGYNLVNGELCINADEAAIVKRIYDDFVNKNVPVGKIAKNLNFEGILKEVENNVQSNQWCRTSVKNILSNPIYKGKIAFGRRTKEKIKGTRNQFKRVRTDDYIVGDGKHEAIVSEELWDKSMTKQKKYAKSHTAQPFKTTYLLTGKLKCPCCGGPMFAQKNTWTVSTGEEIVNCFYKCSNTYKENPTCDNRRRVDQKQVEDFVIKFITDRVKNGFFAAEINRRNQLAVDTSKYDKELKSYKDKYELVLNKKSNLEHEIDNMPLDTPYYDRKIGDLNKRLYSIYDDMAELEERMADVELVIKGLTNRTANGEKVLEFLSQFSDLVAEMNDDERKKCMDFIISDITFNENFAIEYINFNIGKPSSRNELEEMLIGKDMTKYNLSVKVDPSETIYMSKYDKHARRRARKIVNESPEGKSRCGRPKQKVLIEVDGEIVEAYKYTKSYYIPHKRPEHYNRKQPTYQQIKDYVMEKYNVKVHTVYIAEVKRMHGIDMQANRRKNNSKYNCPQDKVALIEDALRYFNILTEGQA